MSFNDLASGFFAGFNSRLMISIDVDSRSVKAYCSFK